MKFKITVELKQGKKPVTAQDIKAFGAVNFTKAAPKAFKRAMKATCWPFNADVEVELIEEPKDGKRVPKNRRKKPKDN
jgi:hypothetical protein